VTTTATTETSTAAERVLSRLIDAIETPDRPALGSVFAEDVRFRASLPRRDIERTGRAEAAAAMLGWFADATDIARVHFAIDVVGDVWHASYRFTLREAGADLVVEQHAYCTITDGLITSIRVMCSGFRPVDNMGAGGGESPAAADVRLEALGEGCATLTPRIATAMRAMQSGQILAVVTDDPSAPDGIAAWSRMTGHEVLRTDTEAGGTRFFLRHV
jgi:TusA-related sulfurtransferase/ketosteroid isomerase-like protein